MPSPSERSVQSPARRRLLLSGAGLGTLLLASGALGTLFMRRSAADDAMDMGGDHRHRGVPRAPWDRNAALVEPEIRRSAGGELRTSLRVAYAYKNIGGYRLALRMYEGNIPAPTLRVQPGDVLRIRLDNQLPPNPDPMPADMTLPHHFNSTNFHFHGGHVSPGGIADNVFRVMEPGQGYDIEIAIPADHPRGTYWYHPHKHGSADIQMVSGMSGVLIIEGDFDDIPEIKAAAEQVLLLNEVLFDYRGTIETYDTVWPEAVPRFLSVNGQREPVIRMRPGEVRRWRIVHTGHEDNLNLALDGHALTAIAFDGIRRPEMARSDALLMAPGQRADVLVKAGVPGTYMLRAIANDQGYPSPTGPLARLIVEGEPLPMPLPKTLGGKSPLKAIGAAEVTNRRLLTLEAVMPEYPPAGNYQEFTYLICGRAFDPQRVDHRIPLGAVEEWRVVNEDESDHVFHIHTNPFQMVAVNDQPVAVEDWRDTVVVPRKGSVTFRTRFLDFTGRFVLHCHMMNHEELGMMQIVEVYDA
ncbi:multicopper oxidase family protein [Aquabacter sp. CN5-332]|uniref:multicopper oxidase family protein n=1 Tax=Aquabacter sp. CN5-332 TaxID=3156608 RepID=UPI0032B42381